MESTSQQYQSVPRDALRGKQFPNHDVLQGDEARKLRSGKIHEATRLGNLEHKKVKIIFQDESSISSVHTTIWAQTTEKIFLKGRVHIPVHRIVDILFDPA